MKTGKAQVTHYHTQAINPATGKLETAEMVDNIYGLHVFGVVFSDGKMYRDDEFDWPRTHAALIEASMPVEGGDADAKGTV